MKDTKYFVIFLIVLFALISTLFILNKYEEKESDKSYVQQFDLNQYLDEIYIEHIRDIGENNSHVESKETESVEIMSVEEENMDEHNKRFETPSVDTDDEILDYMWERSLEEDIAYTLLLAMAKVESDFDPTAKSATDDAGLMQINRHTGQWISDELGVESPNYNDPKLSVDYAIFYINHLRDYWEKQNVSEEMMYELIITGYNAGLQGSKNYIKKHGWGKHPYFIKVDKQKQKYEQEASKN